MTAPPAAARKVPSVMKVVVREPGAADALKAESDFVPDIAAGQVLVKNAFAGINFDTHTGLTPATVLWGARGRRSRGRRFGCQGREGRHKVATRSLAVTRSTRRPGGHACPCRTTPMDVAVSCVVQGLTAHHLTPDAHARSSSPASGCWFMAYVARQWAAMAKIRGYR